MTAAQAKAPPTLHAPWVDAAGIARRLVRNGSRVIGFLPTAKGTGGVGARVMRELAEAMLDFVSGQIALIPDWGAWQGQPSGEATADEAVPRLFTLSPAPCADAGTATLALAETLSSEGSASFERVLVDLGRYAEPGLLPGAAELADGVVLLVPARRTWRHRLNRLVAGLTPERNLGAILIE